MTGMPTYPTGPEPVAGQPTAPLAPASPKPARPVDVQNSVKAWFASIGVGLIAGLLDFFVTDHGEALRSGMASSGLTEEQAKVVLGGGLALALVFRLVGLGLRVFFVFKLRAGRNWARIVLTVLAGISAIGTLTSLGQGFSIALVVTFVALLLEIAAIVLMFRRGAKVYFAAPKV